MQYYGVNTSTEELYHHGVLGMKWGVRRFQNEDGTLTKAGERRYKVNGVAEKRYIGEKKKSFGFS